MTETTALAESSKRKEKHRLLEELHYFLQYLKPEEQMHIASLIESSLDQADPDAEIDELTLIHNFLKAREGQMTMAEYEKINKAKAPEVVKRFSGSEAYPLPEPDTLQGDLKEVLENRTAQRDFNADPVSLNELSTFLFYSYGLKKKISAYNVREFPVRYAPSAGGLQPVDLYLVINQVQDLPKGLYYYNPLDHRVELIDRGNMRSKIKQCGIYSDFLMYAPIVCIMTCNMKRVLWKYGNRAYRFVHVDTGVLTQNMNLVGTALDLNVCPVAAYYDDSVHDLLQIDGKNEFVSLLFTLGHKPFSTSS